MSANMTEWAMPAPTSPEISEMSAPVPPYVNVSAFACSAEKTSSATIDRGRDLSMGGPFLGEGEEENDDGRWEDERLNFRESLAKSKKYT